MLIVRPSLADLGVQMTTELVHRAKRSPWKRLIAGAAILCVAVLLVLQCAGPRHSYHSGPPPRVPKGTTVTSVSVDGLDGDFFHAASEKPQKALILLGGSEGGKSWSDQTEFIQELVEQGFCVLSLGYFGTGDLPADLRGIPLEYFARAFHWLSTQEGLVVPNDYAVMGVSRGAELALLLGSRHPEIRAVVAIAPSSVVFPGPPTGKLDALRGQHSAWSLNGQELAFVPMPYSWTTLRGMITGQRTRMFEKALRNFERVKRAAIPVERIQGPILLVSFKRDQVWPSTLMSEQIVLRLRDSTFRFHYEHAAYDAGHSQWSIQPCRTHILNFLRERVLTSHRERLGAAPKDVLDSTAQKRIAEPGGPANGSQPIRSETNQASAAAGSRR